MVSVLYSLKDGSGGGGHSATLHSSSEEKKKEGQGKKRQRDVWTLLVYVEFCPLHGAFHQRFFNIATWNTWWMGARTRVIIGTVGGIKSCGRGVCVTDISSRFVASCESLRIWGGSLPPFFTQIFFYCSGCTSLQNEPAKGTHHVFLRHAASACMPVHLASHQACLNIVRRWQSWSGRGNPNKKAQTIHFLGGEKLTSVKRLHEKCCFQKTSGCVSSNCTR